MKSKASIRFAINVKKAMKIQNLTQHELAKKSGLTQSYISKLINHQLGPTLDDALSVSHALGYFLSDMLMNTDPPTE